MKLKVSISELLFYISYVMWITVKIIGFSYYRDISFVKDLCTIMNILVLVILIMKFIFDNKHSIKKLTIWCILSIIMFIVATKSKSRDILEIVAFIYTARNIDFRNIVKVTLICQVTLVMLIIFGSFAGIIENQIWLRHDNSMRYGLGFTYCTFSSNFYFHIVLMYIYLKDKMNINLLELLTILSLNSILFKLTDTKAVYFLIIIFILLVYINKYIKKTFNRGIFNKIIFKYCFIYSAIISILASIYYNDSNQMFITLDNILTGRLFQGSKAYTEYGITLFGQYVKWITDGSSIYMYVDSSYLNIAINFGIITLLLICIGFTVICNEALINNKKNISLVLLFFALHNITDPQLLDPRFHPFLIMFACYFNDKKYLNTKLSNLRV